MNPKRTRRRRIAAATGLTIALLAAWRYNGGRGPDDFELAVDDLQIRAASITTSLFGVQPTDLTYGIKLFVPGQGDEPDAWRAVNDTSPRHLVVLLHGLDEPGQIFDDLAPALASAGYDVARFDYPNDQSPALSADLLDQELRAIRTLGTVQIDIVAHSMGGLIARDAMTRDTIYGGSGTGNDALPDVGRLMLVGTPNLGSPWAKLRAIGEFREHIVRFKESDSYDPRQLFKFLADGVGDAGADLLPGSDYLADLNGRPLPTEVAITTIIGEVVKAEGPELAWVRDSKALRTMLGDKKMASLVDAIDDVLTELGDGVVTVRSAKLEGVDDAPKVIASHRGMLLAIGVEKKIREAIKDGQSEPAPAIEIILDRLGRTNEGG